MTRSPRTLPPRRSDPFPGTGFRRRSAATRRFSTAAVPGSAVPRDGRAGAAISGRHRRATLFRDGEPLPQPRFRREEPRRAPGQSMPRRSEPGRSAQTLHRWAPRGRRRAQARSARMVAPEPGLEEPIALLPNPAREDRLGLQEAVPALSRPGRDRSGARPPASAQPVLQTAWASWAPTPSATRDSQARDGQISARVPRISPARSAEFRRQPRSSHALVFGLARPAAADE